MLTAIFINRCFRRKIKNPHDISSIDTVPPSACRSDTKSKASPGCFVPAGIQQRSTVASFGRRMYILQTPRVGFHARAFASLSVLGVP